jgi:DNA-directed RNA polymerase specialized sigma subunit
MERKNYLQEELSKEEKSYLKKLILNVRRKYIKDNYEYLNSNDVNWDTFEDIECNSLFDAVLNKCVDELKSALEFERLFCDEKLYNVTKALSVKEKMVLFALYKEEKGINQIANEMNVERTTIWRIKNKAQEKIIKNLLGGNNNV